ncbi:very long chain fatty acid elongase AAEL008004-like [Ornithodoros turicata]|uniref:very long chain fatty acid elongase AAEL008004-like n=1 Tax=Ornithodoros turicata TaxID=34597 RepID=UPI0031387B7B
MSHLISPILSGQPLLRPDPRTQHWPLCGNFTFITAILVSYIYVIKIAGPRYMKDRKPYDHLKPLILVYNGSMVLLNTYFVYQFASRSYIGGTFNWICQGISYSEDRNSLEIVNLVWWYVMVRIADLLDTIFFVLRKKDSHVSFLHVVHHVLVVLSGWFGVSYGADGQSLLLVIVNSFVHVVMYFYYTLSLMGPNMQKFLGWKRYLTGFQIAQFVAMFVHTVVPVFVDCGYPLSHILFTLPQVAFFFVLFVKFYARAYRKTRADLKTGEGALRRRSEKQLGCVGVKEA